MLLHTLQFAVGAGLALAQAFDGGGGDDVGAFGALAVEIEDAAAGFGYGFLEAVELGRRALVPE